MIYVRKNNTEFYHVLTAVLFWDYWIFIL